MRNRTGAVLAARRRGGFTLIEILVALVILGVVALLAYRATAAMTESEIRLTAESARWRGLDQLFARIEADMRQAIPRSARHGGAVEPAWWARTEGNGDSTLVLTRAGPEFAVEPGMAGQRIGYQLREGRIEVVYWPQLDNVDDAAATAYTLAEGITQFRIQQLGSGNAWLPRWPLSGDVGVPRAARVEIELADGTRIDRMFVLR